MTTVIDYLQVIDQESDIKPLSTMGEPLLS